MNGGQAFGRALGITVRSPWLLLILYLANLLPALLLALLPAMGLSTLLGLRPAITAAADGVDDWLAIESVMSALIDTALGESGSSWSNWVQGGMLYGLLALVGLFLFAAFSAAFLGGGTLLALAEAGQPFRLRRFLGGCWRWFGSFLLLGLIQGGVTLVVGGPLLLIAGGLVFAVGDWLAALLAPLLALLALVWLTWLETARVTAVSGDTRNVAALLRQAARQLWRRPLDFAVLYGLALALLGLLHVVYRWGVRPMLPLEWWAVVLLVQQVFVVGRLAARVARLAAVMGLVRD